MKKKFAMKKVFVILCVAALCLIVLNGCTKKRESGGVSGDLPKKVTVGSIIAIDPCAIAIPEGWLPEALGVEVDIVYFDSGRDVIIAMASGSLDFGYVGLIPAALAIANGVPCKVVYIDSLIGESDALIVRNNLGIRDAQGLVGRRIATPFATNTHYSLMKYLEINNINPKSIDIIDMRTAEIAAAFIRGHIDGAFTWEPNVTRMINNGGVMLTSPRELAERGHPIMSVELVRTAFAERYPDLVSAFIRTFDRAVALYRSDRQAAGAAMARFTGLTVEECLAQADTAVWLSVDEQKSMRWAGSSVLANSLYNTAMFLYEQGDISQEPSRELFQEAVTGQYLDPWEGN